MDKENIERIINIELEFFKTYSFFLIALIAGISSIVITKAYSDKIVFILLIIGIIFLIVVAFFFVYSYIKIQKQTKKLKK